MPWLLAVPFAVLVLAAIYGMVFGRHMAEPYCLNCWCEQKKNVPRSKCQDPYHRSK